MAVVLPGRFGNRTRRPVKRELSRHEKHELPTTDGRALILPGDPGTEVEELTEAGYSPCYIFGVERDERLYRQLVKHYHDSANIFHSDLFLWMKRACQGRYSYIHVDLCGHFTRDEAIAIQSWTPLVAPQARVRVSVSRGHRTPAQFDWEAQMYEDLLLRWCQIGYDNDEVNIERWVEYYDHCEETLDDTTKIIVSLMIMNFFFGINDYRRYIDRCHETESFLPMVEGDHILTNIQRWQYNEPGVPNYMYTTWADLKPMSDPLRTSTQWILNELAKVFEYLNYHVPQFTYTHEAR